MIIVGAGPAGAALAHLLGHRGVDVHLIERQRDFAREFRGEVLMPSGVLALEQMGLRGLLDGVPHHRPESMTVFLRRRQVLRVELDDGVVDAFFDGRPPMAVSQVGLLEALVSDAEKSGRVHFHRGTSTRDLLIEGDRVVGVRARTAEREIELEADLVIGTDGRASIVRRRGGLAARKTDPPMDIVWCKVPCPEGERGARAYLGRGHLLVAYQTWDRNLQVGWVILKGTYGDLRRQGIEHWVGEMAEHVDPDLGAHLRACESLLGHPFLLDVVSDRVERWWTPGVLVLGDAAHTMSPVGGQGLNVALRDAVVAANHLVGSLQAGVPGSDSVDRACAAIERERRPEIEQIQRLQSLPPKVVLNRSWWAEPVRGLFARLIRTPFVQQRGLDVFRQFAFGIGTADLRV